MVERGGEEAPLVPERREIDGRQERWEGGVAGMEIEGEGREARGPGMGAGRGAGVVEGREGGDGMGLECR
jgi:hypothetical protein